MAQRNLKSVAERVQQDVEVQNPQEHIEVLQAACVIDFSEGLQRRLRRLGIGFVPKKKETFYTNLCRLKCRVSFEECKDVIYSIPCKTCGIRYIESNK